MLAWKPLLTVTLGARPKPFPPASVVSFGPIPAVDSACHNSATSYSNSTVTSSSNSTNTACGRVPVSRSGPRFDLVASPPVPDCWHVDDGEVDLRGRLKEEYRNRQLRRQLDISDKAAEKREQELQQKVELLSQLLEQKEAELSNVVSCKICRVYHY